MSRSVSLEIVTTKLKYIISVLQNLPDVITVCFLPSAEYYYVSQQIVPTITEQHASLSAPQQDTAAVVVTEVAAEDCTSPININPIEHSVMQEMHIHITYRQCIPLLHTKKLLYRKNCLQIIVNTALSYRKPNLQYSTHVFRRMCQHTRKLIKDEKLNPVRLGVHGLRLQIINNVQYFNYQRNLNILLEPTTV